jgi:hypothetical protein
MRHSARVFIVGLVLAGIGAWALWNTFKSPGEVVPAPAEGTVAYAVLAAGERSDVQERKNYFISSAYELRDLWKLIQTDRPLPQIDFNKESVLAVFAGTRPSAGFSIAVISVKDAHGSPPMRTVSIEVIEPGISCLAAQVETAPYQVIRVPKADRLLRHQDTSRVVGCLQ